MNDDPSDMAGEDEARFLLEQSKKSVTDLLYALDLMAERMNAGDDVPATDVIKAIVALSQARTKLINEAKDHDYRVLFAKGRTAEAPLDLEAIRAEIGSRLDRIRKSIDEEEIH